MASTYQLFQRAERIEIVAGNVYAALAGQFRDDPEAKALFAKLAVEEEQHAARVRLLAAHYRHDSRILGPGETDSTGLDGCLAECERALAEVEAGAWGRDLSEVKGRLAALEEGLAQAHADLLLGETNPELREFFAQLAAQDVGHARLLGG